MENVNLSLNRKKPTRRKNLQSSSRKYEKRLISQKERKFENQNANRNHVGSDILKILGRKLRKDLKTKLKTPYPIGRDYHSKVFKSIETQFETKRSKIKELLKMQKSFKPKYSIIPFAKKVIDPRSQMSSFKFERLLQLKLNRTKRKKRRLNSGKKSMTKTCNRRQLRARSIREKFKSQGTGLTEILCSTRTNSENRCFEQMLRSNPKASERDKIYFLQNILATSKQRQESTANTQATTKLKRTAVESIKLVNFTLQNRFKYIAWLCAAFGGL